VHALERSDKSRKRNEEALVSAINALEERVRAMDSQAGMRLELRASE
jgi:hypothetical protein